MLHQKRLPAWESACDLASTKPYKQMQRLAASAQQARMIVFVAAELTAAQS
jgi:hypothetical protein